MAFGSRRQTQPGIRRGTAVARDALVCPACRSELLTLGDSLGCKACARSYRVHDGVPHLRIDKPDSAEGSYLRGWKGWIRRRRRLWPIIERLAVPVMAVGPDPTKRLAPLLGTGLVVEAGAGNTRRHESIVMVDLIAFPEVDIVADCEALPFRNGSVQGMISVMVLEHTPRPDVLLSEAARVLERSGRLFMVAPFMQPFHAAPHDYTRWTSSGLRSVIEAAGFDVTDVGVYAGPASTMAWALAEFVAIVLSLGNRKVRAFLSPVFQVLFSPLKWLDIAIARHPQASILASSVYVEAVRR